MERWRIPGHPAIVDGLIKRTQTGTIVMGAAVGTLAATVLAFDLANSIVQFEGATGSAAADDSSTYGLLTVTNSTTLTATRNGGAGTCTIYYKIREFWPGVLRSVQYGGIVHGNTTNAPATVTAVDTARAFIVPMGNFVNIGAASDSSKDQTAWAIDSATQISVRTGVNATPNDQANYGLVEVN